MVEVIVFWSNQKNFQFNAIQKNKIKTKKEESFVELKNSKNSGICKHL